MLKYPIDMNIPLSESLCEFVGAIIGDGCTNRYGKIYQTQIAGDKNLDLEYHSYLCKICEQLFDYSPKIIKRENGIYFNIYSRALFELLTNRFNIPAGMKCYSVIIPQEIMAADEKMLRATLRGMFNTDGGVGIDRRSTYKKPYIRVNYTSASEMLIRQISGILIQYDLPHSIHKTNLNNINPTRQIQINGERNVSAFLHKIGFSNPRHLSKVDHLLS
jgi:hypothetical protein